MTALLKWWLILCLSLLGGAIAIYFNVHVELYNADITKLSFVISLIYIMTTIWIGKGMRDTINTNVAWFISESLTSLGMIGTMVGFIYMLLAFENIDISQIATLQTTLIMIAKGMGTAIYTTLVGLICSQGLKIQLVNYEER